ncbi:39S ribosomal protein L41, mitochondrial-like [Daphnia pulex]|uniref:EOG090X0IZW n=1 Tax=Daphnia pulicaria TaxID=35523 RepID=A0A4Y7MZ37_9CRUS|nr:39S ribosomal protein L41, mitochondrial-like [Daphnia pulex]XP_046464476.1 39S ribosomal protein L41, mitochondrial-like [Daphnia pulex]SVE85882.1 EOG090X0IZW [Daphnia pulicaria]
MELNMLTAFGKQFVRGISTTACACGKRNFKKFPIYNKRGTRDFKAKQAKNPHPDVPIHTYGVRPIGYKNGSAFVEIKELIPEIIVPDLTGFKLKPYVSYRTSDIVQPPLTPEELFGAVYVKKITEDFKAGKLGPDNQSLEPSAAERLTPEEAKEKVSSIRSDIV